MPKTKTDSPAHIAKALSLLDHLSVGVVGLVASGEIVFVNRLLNRFLGYESDALTGQQIFSLDPYLNLFTWKNIWKQLEAEGTYHSTSLLMRADGRVVPVKVKGVFETIADRQMVLFLVEDEMKARSNIDMLSVLSQNARVGAWEYNSLTGKIVLAGVANEWTDAPEDTLRSYHRGEFFTMLEDWLVPSEKRNLLAQVTRAIDRKSSFSYTLPFNLTDKVTLQLCIEGKCEVDQQGEVTKLFGVAWDEKQQVREDGEQAFLGQFSIEHANDFIFWVREDGSFAYVNQSACQRLGYTWEEFQEIDVTHINAAPPEERPRIWEQLRARKSMVIEAELVSKSGELIPVSAALNLITYDDQVYNCVFCRDLSEQRERREQLLRTEFALSNIKEAIVWIDGKGRIEYANKYFGKLAGVSIEELLDQPIRERFTVPNSVADQPDFWSWLRNTEEDEWEGSMVAANGEKIPIYGTLNQLVYEDRTLICLFLRDWRKKRDRDRKLLLAQQSVMASHDLVIWIDEDYRIEFANNIAQQILQNYRSRFLGTSLSEFIHESKALNEVMLRSEGVVEFKTDTEALILVEFRSSRIEAAGVVMYSLIGRDVTRQRRREEELVQTKEELVQMSTQLQRENLLLREEINTTYDFNNIITRSKDYRQKVLTKVAQVAGSDATVLILGETGTGKELLARAIHSLSDRDEAPLIKVNCAALPPNLIESELFGHEKGAFTGAQNRKTGRFELADGGTLFLDEVGEMPLDLQAKMLRVLQEGEFERVGGTETIKIDVRIIAATNRNLEKMVAAGTFREDLYYRLNVFPILNTPLRERKEDIPLLVRHFATKYSERLKRNIEEIPTADLELLSKHDFPGNIRELENMIERAVILSTNKVLNLRGGMSFEGGKQPSIANAGNRILPFKEMQRRHILAALKKTEGRVTGPEGAARLLQLNDRTLASKMRKLGIKRDDYLRET